MRTSRVASRRRVGAHVSRLTGQGSRAEAARGRGAAPPQQPQVQAGLSPIRPQVNNDTVVDAPEILRLD